VLIVDEMGKNISGAGLDTNVIGRFYNLVAHEPPRRASSASMSGTSHRKAWVTRPGIGLADFVHRRIVEKMDPRRRGRIP